MGVSGDKDYYAEGYGIYTDPENNTYEGLWKKGVLLLDKDEMKNITKEDILELRKQTKAKKIEYENGVIYEGTWEGYAWKSGKVTINGEQSNFPDVDEKKKYRMEELRKMMNDILKLPNVGKKLMEKKLLLVKLDSYKPHKEKVDHLYKELLKKQRIWDKNKDIIHFLFNMNFIDINTAVYNSSNSRVVSNDSSRGHDIYYINQGIYFNFLIFN